MLPPPFFILPAPIFLRKTSGKPKERSWHHQKSRKNRWFFTKNHDKNFQNIFSRFCLVHFSFWSRSIDRAWFRHLERNGTRLRNGISTVRDAKIINFHSFFSIFPQTFRNLSWSFPEELLRNSERTEPKNSKTPKNSIILPKLVILETSKGTHCFTWLQNQINQLAES